MREYTAIRPAQFGLPAPTTLDHLSISVRMKAPYSWGVIGIGSAPSARMRSTTSGSLSTFTNAVLRVVITSAGVPAGATMPNQPFDSKPGSPDSAKVGICSNRGNRLADETAIVLIWPASICAIPDG